MIGQVSAKESREKYLKQQQEKKVGFLRLVADFILAIITERGTDGWLLNFGGFSFRYEITKEQEKIIRAYYHPHEPYGLGGAKLVLGMRQVKNENLYNVETFDRMPSWQTRLKTVMQDPEKIATQLDLNALAAKGGTRQQLHKKNTSPQKSGMGLPRRTHRL